MDHAQPTVSTTRHNLQSGLNSAALSRDELENELTALAANINAATYRWLVLLAEYDSRDGFGGRGLKSCAHWLNWRCGITLGAAREQVRVARALGELPQISAAFAIGEVSFSKVRSMTRVATPGNEDFLLQISRHGTASHLEKLVRCYRRVSRREDEASRAVRQIEDRSLSYYYDDDGCLVFRGKLPPEQGEALLKALDAAGECQYQADKRVSAETLSAEVSAGETPRPTIVQRRADALCLMAESFHADTARTRSGGDRCQVVVHVDESVLRDPGSDGRCECEHGTLAADTARRLGCDATILRVIEDDNGDPLSVGRKTRSIPPALRRALQIRDRGCTFPGCTSTHFVEAHHVKHWADGGETRADNLLLLCRHHHRLLHEDGFSLSRDRDGVARFHAPDGSFIAHAVSPLRSDLPVENINSENGVTPDAKTVRARWLGEDMDYDIGVLVLQQRGRRDKLH